MPQFASPLINGVNYSWCNLTFVLFGVPVIGITKINYKEKQDKKNNFGFGTRPVSRGYGNVEPEGSIELYIDEWKRIIKSAPNNRVLDIPPFDVSVVYSGNAQGLLPTKDILRAVEFLEDPMDSNQGDTKILVTIPLIIAQVDRY